MPTSVSCAAVSDGNYEEEDEIVLRWTLIEKIISVVLDAKGATNGLLLRIARSTL
jgi:hypothetical protein